MKARGIHHYLVTMDLGPVHLHAYLIGKQNDEMIAVEQMEKVAHEHGATGPTTQMVLITRLASGVSTVRRIIGKYSEDAKQAFLTATDFHLSVWMMPKDNPDDAKLMDLH